MKKRYYATTMLMFVLLFCSKNVYAEDSTWQNDYQYTKDDTNHEIVLGKYIGSEKNLTVPAKAIINGVEYTTYIGDTKSGFNLQSKWEGVESITFNEGVKSNSNLSCLFANSDCLVSLNLTGLDTSNAPDMEWMFYGCESLISVDLSNFKTSNVKSMIRMFSGCGSLTSLDLSSFDTSYVINMHSMFDGCKSLSGLDLSGFDTSNVVSMASMFNQCTKLKNLDLRNFNTSNVTTMNGMFSGCGSLTSLDLSSFDTSNVKSKHSMEEMISNCFSLTLIKTPLNVRVDAVLPGTFSDSSGATYTLLPKNMATSILLTKNTQVDSGKHNRSAMKQSQPMTVKTTKKTVKAKKLKKKKQVISPITVKSAQGIVAYRINGGNKKSRKALKINAKTGKITVKKGTKKGTYKIKVKVTAAGNENYKAGSKTMAVKVVVK